MNHLLLDVGNTRVHVAAHVNGRLSPMVHAPWTDRTACAQAIGAAWDCLPADHARSAVAGAVNPGHLATLRALLAERNIALAVVRDDLPLPMPLAVDNPAAVGVDRVCAAAAAYDVLKSAVVVASFGTAITVDAVSAEGEFLGGAILPGLELSARALHEFTGALPLATIAAPTRAIGRNTEQAISGGIVQGAVGALRELVERYAEELGAWPMVVATGGAAPLILEHTELIDRHVPDLVLRGLHLAASKHERRHATGL